MVNENGIELWIYKHVTSIIEMELNVGYSSIFHCTVLYLHTHTHILQLPEKLILHLSLSEALRLILGKIH